MKIALYTIDCFKGREYLMPWRTLFEVARVMTKEGHCATIVNACNDEKHVVDYEWQSVMIKSVIKIDDCVMNTFKELMPDTIFIPFTFRDGLKPEKWISQIHCNKIGYMTGGMYDFKSGCLLSSYGGIHAALPYLLESLIPKTIFASTVKKICISHVIGLTEKTAETVKSAGCKNVSIIYPGKDPFDELEPDDSILKKYNIKNKQWLLFSGAPAPTRGAEILLQAVDNCTDDSIRLVMLMRTDVGSQYEKIEQVLANMRHPERVQVIKEKLTREQLRAFFGSAWYALLPFIVIPSEVPLTYFELLSCGTPVITFENGGTTEYLKEGLVIADKSVKGLTRVLDESWNNIELRNLKSKSGISIMKKHPDWKTVGKEWIKLLD